MMHSQKCDTLFSFTLLKKHDHPNDHSINKKDSLHFSNNVGKYMNP